ncbi:hypothetical protein QE152_g37538 [Popillia japonica]|uniref:Fibronectin type-III domain-containing protein n=1 Tax=Popillia japonica TaxID=7064 RepID=A0AAW1I9T4_POPJA
MPTTERCARISKIVAYSSIILLIIALLVVTILSVLPNYIDDTECSEFTYPPNEMSYAHYGDGTVEVSWNIDPIDVRCGVAYNLTFIYEVAPQNQQISDLLIYEVQDLLYITWQKPQNLMGCPVTYYISYSSSLVDESTYTDIIEVRIPLDKFCFRLSIKIEVLVDWKHNSITPHEYYTTPNVENFRVDDRTESNIVLRWDPHPKGERCFLLYKIVRIINEEELEVVETRLNSYTFKFNYCEDTRFIITAFSSNSESEPVAIDATQCT